MVSLDNVEKAVRNIAQGKNAKSLIVGMVQARIVKTLMEEGVIPLQLLEQGYIHDIDSIKRREDDFKNETTTNKNHR